MLFNSWPYAIFLPAVLAGYWVLRGRARVIFLLASSYLFYAAWDWRFLGLIWLSTVVDFTVGRRLDSTSSPARRKRLLITSVAVNLGILGVFKYAGFFVDSAGDLLGRIGFQANLPLLSVALPVGISFYTFQTMAYTIDVYREKLAHEPRFEVFALYVAFFPQLVAGPIERAQRLLPQLRSLPARLEADDVKEGLRLIGLGLFRKLALADGVAPFVNEVFADPSSQHPVTLWMGAIAFGIQIYGDFAGYTDMARGSARLMGVELVINFRQPYLARSFSEFWRRWHISLSEWLRDYLYIPLGGNRGGRRATMRNLMLTMLLGGLWHGAAWTFVLWGGLHGLYLAAERAFSVRKVSERTGPGWIALTFALVTVAWVPFRAEGIAVAGEYLLGMMLMGQGAAVPDYSPLMYVSVAVFVAFMLDRTLEAQAGLRIARPAFSGALWGLALLLVVVMSGSTAQPFIYFQF